MEQIHFAVKYGALDSKNDSEVKNRRSYLV